MLLSSSVLRVIILVLIFILPSTFAQEFSRYFSTSYFFTYGENNNGNISRSHAFYNTTAIDEQYYASISAEHLYTNNPFWNYAQNMILAGVTADYYPAYLSLRYAHFKGDFTLLPVPMFEASQYNYSDYSNLYNAEYSYYDGSWGFGTAATYFITHGILTRDSVRHQYSVQLGLRTDKVINADFSFSLRPVYIIQEDKRKLFSVNVKVHWNVGGGFVAHVGGFLGKRAYYFDTETYTIFNQYETQKNQWFISGEFPVFDMFKLTASYQSTSFQGGKFEGYKINYFSVGLRNSIWL